MATRRDAARVQAQREALEALKRRPMPVQAPAPKPATPAPAPKPHGSILFVSHDLKAPPEGPKASEYTLAPVRRNSRAS